MKSKIMTFAAGALTALLLSSTTLTALAASGAVSIEISPIKVLVNGEVFQPKDVNGNDVRVFVSEGTTYAPVRALAEAYGLTVGYDPVRNIATVDAPSTQAPQIPEPEDGYAAFEKVWTVAEKPVTNYGSEKIFTMTYSGSLSQSEFKQWWKSYSLDTLKDYTERMTAEAQGLVPGYTVTAYFSYGQWSLGTVHADGNITGSNFDPAGVWIK